MLAPPRCFTCNALFSPHTITTKSTDLRLTRRMCCRRMAIGYEASLPLVIVKARQLKELETDPRATAHTTADADM